MAEDTDTLYEIWRKHEQAIAEEMARRIRDVGKQNETLLIFDRTLSEIITRCGHWSIGLGELGGLFFSLPSLAYADDHEARIPLAKLLAEEAKSDEDPLFALDIFQEAVMQSFDEARAALMGAAA